MYCPQCAAPNIDEAKFCRGCGTDLERVSLALANNLPAKDSKGKTKKPKAAKDPLQKQIEGTRNVVQGALLLTTSILIGVALGFFSNVQDWIIIWTVFFGWMACWGVFALASGIGDLMEARLTRREAAQGISAAAPTAQLLSTEDPFLIGGSSTAPDLVAPPSVTEHTTEHLHRRRPSQDN